MALINRLAVLTPESELEPEDFLHAALATIFPDDVAVQHGEPGRGDSAGGLEWRSPHLPRPLRITLAEPPDRADRFRFSHYLWNASLLLAELVEAGSLGVPLGAPTGLGRFPSGEDAPADQGANGGAAETARPETKGDQHHHDIADGEDQDAAAAGLALADFSAQGRRVLELGAGTALPSLVAALAGAARVAATDYPSPPMLAALAANVVANTTPAHSPLDPPRAAPATVHGHAWGVLAGDGEEAKFAQANKGAFDTVYACDCLWMPAQHGNLRRSIGWFLAEEEEGGEGGEEEKKKKGAAIPRAFVVAGFHSGREGMRGFFDAGALRADAGLEVERIWERDCDGVERPWAWDRGPEDVTERKRWLTVGVLRRVRKGAEKGDVGKE